MPDIETLPVTPEAPQAATPAGHVAPPAVSFTGTPPEAEQPIPAGAEQTATPPPPAVPPPVSPEVRQYIASLEAQQRITRLEEQQYIARLEEQSEHVRTQENRQVIQGFVSTLAARLENEQGLTPEQAQVVSEREGAQAYRAYQASQFRQGQINAAFEIGQQYGVHPQQLMNMATPEAMHRAAKLATTFTAAQSRLAALEAENNSLKKRLAPPQTFATGTGAPGTVSGPVTRARLENMSLEEYKTWRNNGGLK